jgi:tryptophan-rich sensory protein
MSPLKLIASILISFTAGAIGSLATIPNIATWYANLAKPALNPPNFVFGPVWSVLYLMIGVSLYLVWVSPSAKGKTIAYASFAVQLALNALWSLVFFGLHQPDIAVGVIGLLVGAIVVNIVWAYKFSRLAAYLLIPYLAWTIFAAYLTIGVAGLN